MLGPTRNGRILQATGLAETADISLYAEVLIRFTGD